MNRERAAASTTGSPARVLVVDDEPANRKLLSMLVRADGHTVDEAPEGRTALEMMRAQPYDLILLDLMMPVLDGQAVLADLHRTGQLGGMPVVIVTALDSREARRQALVGGATDFLTKPFDRLEVMCKVRALLELSRLRGAALREAQQGAREHTVTATQSAIAGLPLVIYESRATTAGPELPPLLIGDAAALFDLSPDALAAGTLPLARVHPDDLEAVRAGMHANPATADTPSPVRFRLRVRGAWRWCLNTSTRDPQSGRLRGVLLDIDDQVAVEEQLRQSQKLEALGLLAGGIAHDFNNLLSVIISYTSLAHEELPEDAPVRAYLDEVLTAGDRAVGVTRQLLTYSHQRPLQPKLIDLNQQITSLRGLLHNGVTERIQLEFILSPHPAVVHIDPVQFDQTLLNLAVNARDAMPDGGSLQIRVDVEAPTRAGHAGGSVHVRVQDTGEGMDAATRARIFEPFFTTKAPGAGTGLGLSMSKAHIETAGGSIRVDSAPGEGTVFTITLPRSASAPAPQPARLAPQRQACVGELLIAEDDDQLRRATVQGLEAAGYRVHAAQDGAEAIRLLDELGPRLAAVISDVVMPKRSGFDVVAHAARVAPSAVPLLVSGYVDGSIADHGLDDVPILWKPLRLGELLAALEGAIAERGVGFPPGSAGPFLVLSSDPLARDTTRQTLEKLGHSTEVVATARAAQDAIAGGLAPRAVLCDLDGEAGEGHALLAWMREHAPRLACRAALMTCEPEAVVPPAGTTAGPPVLGKPITADALEALLEAPEARVPAPSVPADAPDRPIAAPQPSRQRSAPVAARHILLVDDEVALMSAWARALECAGHQVTAACDRAEALHWLEACAFDAIVVDIGLGDHSGIDVLQAARDRDPHIPVVMVSGGAPMSATAAVVRLHANDLLTKPFPPDQLVETLEQAVTDNQLNRLRGRLLAARFGGDELFEDLERTRTRFESTLGSLHMAYQPIIRPDGTAFAFEALLRSSAPDALSPPRLLAAAEILERIPDVGHAVRAAVARDIHGRPDRMERLFINIHPSELSVEQLCDAAEPLLQLAHRVVLEVTERAGLSAGPELSRTLRQLREAGFEIAVDDLGEGYAGLTSLVALRPEFAKLDMSLVQGIDDAPLKRDIVAAMVDLAHRSGISVVAEGVERAEEREILTSLGVDLLQGYLIARPAPGFPMPIPAGALPVTHA